ncbi:hypothetical protein [Sediminibacillus albus]|uniref:Uncharacterized protein n=1 Tax=Sediminibacillus albus TaxID=407036 RepID=A0A1G9A4T4_9BACI|nr:hypothetical protein [Sediminibacillus albus]SDK21460.1 hypothetical protein SAMN05216243_2370 [Sediminibacillus albus]
MKKIIAIAVFVFSLAALSVGFGTMTASAQEKYEAVKTPGDYMEYLNEKIEQHETLNKKTLNMNSKPAPAQEVLQKFKELPKEKQKKFVEYLNDPELMKEIMESINELKPGESLKLKGGDVTVSSSINKSNFSTMSTRWDIWHEWTHSQFGLDIMRLRAEAAYTANSSRVTGMIDGRGNVERELTAFTTLTKIRDEEFTNLGLAYGGAYYSYNIRFPNGGIQAGTVTHHVFGDEDGVIGGYVDGDL